ncbi:hypothetical protein [Rosistilla oblonga]|uniref:hypothetical protein n=1 Tax=Rosistilla oblonga TaxID=2527990 RepID=UPI003A97A95B
MLTVSEKVAWMMDTLRVLSSLSELPADEVDYQVYENLDADVRAALCVDNLREIAQAELLSPKVVAEIEFIRDATVLLIDRRIPGADLTEHDEWRHVISRAKTALDSISK